MPASEPLGGIIAIITGYLLGSFPTAYLIARLITGRDIRHLGGGNVGGLTPCRRWHITGRWP